jgi:16S rRNA (cytosine967-C5)-methyltransferase
MAASPARKAAYQILLAVEQSSSHSDDLLRGRHTAKLSAVDQNLATALVLGVLRWQIRLDQEIRRFLERPNTRLDPEVQIALRLGAFQLLATDRIPAHAAIDESVELAKQAGHRFAARMVNAVLRKLAGVAGGLQSEFESAQSAEQAYPEWMVERWRRVYESEMARAICVHGQREPRPALRLADAQVEDELLQSGVQLEPGKLLSAARAVLSGDVTGTAAFQTGRVRFQDEGSQLVAEIAGHGEAILDCCAAPGGKTLILAERNLSARITACDASPQRLARLRERLASFGERIECRLSDAAELTDENAYDLVLVDAPCSGTGTLGRNPEIRHRLRLEDLPRQAARQADLLRGALRAVREAGRVVYSTCSLEPEENEAVLAEVLKSESGMRIVPMRERIEAMASQGILAAQSATRLASCITPDGYLRLLPDAFGTDGFLIALLEKN